MAELSDVVGDGQNALLTDETADLLISLLDPLLVVFRACGRFEGRHVAVLVVLQFEKRPAPMKLPIPDCGDVLHGEGHVQDVLEVPLIILPPDARRCIHPAFLEPVPELDNRLQGRLGFGHRVRVVFLEPLIQVSKPTDGSLWRNLPVRMSMAHAVWLLEISQRHHAELTGALGETAVGLVKEGGHRLQPVFEIRQLFCARGKLLKRHSLHGADVDTGVPRPWLQHSELEVEFVELGPNQEVVHLFRDRPSAGVDGFESAEETAQAGNLGFHLLRAVVGQAVSGHRFAKLEELLVQLDECLIVTSLHPASACNETQGKPSGCRHANHSFSHRNIPSGITCLSTHSARPRA